MSGAFFFSLRVFLRNRLGFEERPDTNGNVYRSVTMQRNFVLSSWMASRLPGGLLLLFDWTGNCRRWSSNVIRLNQTFPSTAFVAVQKKFLCTTLNTWVSARYLPAHVALVACCPEAAILYLENRGNSRYTSSQSKRKRAAPRHRDFIKSPGQQILLISAFQVTSRRLTVPAASAIEKICSRVLFLMLYS